MGRWLVASLLLAGGLAVGWIAFLNDGEPLAIRLLPTRSVTLSIGTALALAAAFGAAWVGALGLAGAVLRAGRGAIARRRRDRKARTLARTRTQAERLLVDGDAERARARLASTLAAHGDDPALLELLAGACEQSGDVDGAIANLERARGRLPNSPVLLRRLRDLYAAATRWEEALAVERGLLMELRSPASLAAESTTLCGLRYAAALADTEPARTLGRLLAITREHPEFVPAWVAAGQRLRDAGHAHQARQLLERGAATTGATILLERLVEIGTAEGKPDRAVGALRRLHRRRPRDVAVLRALVLHHFAAGALDDAEAALAAWHDEGPTSPVVEALRGECCRRRGRPEQANVHLSHATDALLGRWSCAACGRATAAWDARCEACGTWGSVGTPGDATGPNPSDDLISPPRRSTDPGHCVEGSPG